VSGADRAIFYDTLLALGEESRATRYFSRMTSRIAGIIIDSWRVMVRRLSAGRLPGKPPLTFLATAAVLLPGPSSPSPCASRSEKRSMGRSYARDQRFTHIFRTPRLAAFP